MAVATPYTDLQPVRRIDDAEAQRISNKIDEELKVTSSSRVVSSMFDAITPGGEGDHSAAEEPATRCQR